MKFSSIFLTTSMSSPIKVIVLFVIATSSFWAQASLTACLTSSLKARSFDKKIRPFLIDGEELQQQSAMCFGLTLATERAQLLRKLILLEFPEAEVKVTVSTVESSRVPESCDFDIIEQKVNERSRQRVSLGRKSKLSATKNRSRQQKTSIIKVSEGRSASFRMGDLSIYLHCLDKNKTTYQVELSLYSESSGISVSLTLSQGEKKEIGQTLIELDREHRKVDTGSGMALENQRGKADTYYYLLAK